MLRVGLNPYGLTWVLGLRGRGTPRHNPNGRSLEGFLAIAEELDAEVVEIFDPWLAELSDDALARLRERLVARIRAVLAEWGPRVDDLGCRFAIENHQDFTSAELAAFCTETRGVGITFDTGNTFPVGEAPLDFARVVAPHVRHVHLKDYRVQFTSEGFRLVRCALGDGAVPFRELLAILRAHHHELTAVLEPGALEARHVRLFTPGWWQGYPPKAAPEFAACLLAAQTNRLPEDADHRTPWERGRDDELEACELAMIRRSAATLRSLGIV